MISVRTLKSSNPDIRRIYLNVCDEAIKQNDSFYVPNNRVKTTKYNLLNFIPKNLYEQMHRAANVYFVIVTVLGFLPTSPWNPWSMVFPLVFVLAATLIKDAFEDFRRFRSDQEINKRKTKLFDPISHQYVTTTWENVKIGDIVRVEEGSSVPADILLIASSKCESGKPGTVYFDTSNLDGETSLKNRNIVSLPTDLTPEVDKKKSYTSLLDNTAGSDVRRYSDALSRLQSAGGTQIFLPTCLYAECSKPNDDIYAFNGTVNVSSGIQQPTKPISTSLNNTAWRGVVLRDTSWILGLVIYTGIESKIMLNATPPRHKVSKVHHSMNLFLYALFTLEACIVIISSILGTIWRNENDEIHTYLLISENKDITIFFFEQILTFICAYTWMIPISLYVLMEINRTIVGQFLQYDIQMYHEKSDTPTSTITFGVVEDLGQIEYLFTDKTGTLTENQMIFAKCSIKGTVYETEEEQSDDIPTNLNFKLDPKIKSKVSKVSFVNQKMLTSLTNNYKIVFDIMDYTDQDILSNDNKTLADFWLCITLCNSVIIEETGCLHYTGASPDEVALVSAAAKMGIQLIDRQHNQVSVNIMGENVTYEILNTLEFTSERKMMSVLVKCPNGKLRLFSKGADIAIFNLMNNNSKNDNIFEDTEKDLKKFASEGLRTLAMASKYISEENYSEWSPRYMNAMNDINNRDQMLKEVARLIENDLNFHGISAIEDKLQMGVSDTIKQLSLAGIKIWMLTGDMQETAINIGNSCNLIQDDMEIEIINEDSVEDTTNRINSIIDKYSLDEKRGGKKAKLIHQATQLEISSFRKDFAIVINGSTLDHSLSPKNIDIFMNIVTVASVVICCRAAPLQKAEVVSLVKSRLKKMTLAIGDGANDCSMISTAHVGVGISEDNHLYHLGHEGMQAVRSSDFAFSQFRFLEKLLLVHGRWNYQRITFLIVYFFYRNLAYAMIEFFFNYWQGYTGQVWFPEWPVLAYNTFFAPLMVLAYGCLDRDVEPSSVKKYPQLYRSGILNLAFNPYTLVWWVIIAIFHGAICFFPCIFALDTVSHIDGKPMGMWFASYTSFICLNFVVTLQLVFYTHSWTWINNVSVWLVQFVIFIGFMIVMCVEPIVVLLPGNWKMLDIYIRVFSTPACWFILIGIPLLAMIPNIFQMGLFRYLMPQPFQIVQEMERNNRNNSNKRDILLS